MPYVPALDGLRGAAVVAVVAFHFGWLPGGWLGVDAFFTLSGFLITSLLLAEAGAAGDGRFDLRAFWRRRVRRLQPAALVAVAAIVATAPWWAPAGTGASVWREALAALGSVANWQALWAHHPYAAASAPSAFEHFWSLAIEEQFYVVWPLVLFGLAVSRRCDRRTVALVAGAGTVLSWSTLALHHATLQRAYLGTDGRIGSILLGCTVAAVLPLIRRDWVIAGAIARQSPNLVGFGALGALVLLWVAGGWPPHVPLAVLLPVHAVLTALVLVRPSRVLEWRPLVALGRVSYGLYLWHWPVLVLVTPERLGANWLMTDAVRLAVTAACTAASWYLIEHPIRVGRILPRTRPAWAAAAVAVVAVAAVGSRAVGPAPVWAQATGELVAARTPAAGPVDHRVLIVGDSVPTSLMAGDAVGSWQVADDHLHGALAGRGIAAAGATVTSCPVLAEVVVLKGQGPNEGCPAILDRVLPNAFDRFHPDVVLWYSRQDAYEIRTSDGRTEDPIDDTGAAARLRRRYADRLAEFAARGAQVILVSPGPNAPGNDRHDERGDSERSMAFLDAQLRRVAAEHAGAVLGVVAMREFTDRHPEARGDDGLHFAGDGAAQASAWLAARVAELLGVSR
jgi:peptidoglycan/LPS O-acetylase OafA/YrhL